MCIYVGCTIISLHELHMTYVFALASMNSSPTLSVDKRRPAVYTCMYAFIKTLQENTTSQVQVYTVHVYTILICKLLCLFVRDISLQDYRNIVEQGLV